MKWRNRGKEALTLRAAETYTSARVTTGRQDPAHSARFTALRALWTADRWLPFSFPAHTDRHTHTHTHIKYTSPQTILAVYDLVHMRLNSFNLKKDFCL